ncbi:hypothetical protein WICPIJ_005004 [Wickerhamomyces pijperi]|uniref:Uncharacterized protein n=1 Tax=Wickerhamomyces pijperi TaxID=599730 RepID=A0A9P8Q4D1_WICPI|nr:hypothetical protein WICPIJ_005004 [Wickerhamomyces pijperi]
MSENNIPPLDFSTSSFMLLTTELYCSSFVEKRVSTFGVSVIKSLEVWPLSVCSDFVPRPNSLQPKRTLEVSSSILPVNPVDWSRCLSPSLTRLATPSRDSKNDSSISIESKTLVIQSSTSSNSIPIISSFSLRLLSPSSSRFEISSG